MFWIFLTTWSMVLTGEIIGDKSLYTIGTLASRYRITPIFWGSTIAFMIKMMSAVLFASLINHLPEWATVLLNVVTFLGIGLIIWNKSRAVKENSPYPERTWLGVASTSFAGILLTEWGDIGQLTAANLALKYHYPLVIWLGAVTAMMTKGILIMFFGSSLKKILPPDFLRYLGTACCLLMAILSLIQRD
jgi:putative Ca2+/H+ antiporter (TMEM165/GDT1 family)